jgi:uncharacterized protein YkwD
MAAAAIRLIAIGATAPREFSSDAKGIAIGSAAGNDFVIANEPSVSRRHAKIECRRGSYRIIDLESTNGTFVNDARVRGALTFKIGDVLRFGSARYRFNPLIAKKSSIVTARAVVIFAVLFAIAFGVTEFRVIWNQLGEPDANRAASVAPAANPTSAAPARSPSAASGAIAPSAASSTGPVAAAPVATASIVPGTAPAAGASPSWLEALNRYRAMSGVAPVANDEATSGGDEAHARYLVENYRDSIARSIGIGAKMHEEDPANRWYTPAGARAANSSDVAQWPGPHPPPSPLWAFDGWMSAPFHRLSMLNPRLHTASLGNWCEGAVCVVTLNVTAGADKIERDTALPTPIKFPGPDATLTMNSSEGEWPDPLTACPGYTTPSGLPITLQIGYFHTVKLDSYTLTLDGSPVEACGIDSLSYVNPDAESQRRAREILNAFGAVVVVPRDPLAAGKYDVAITADGKPYRWSFTIAPAGP